MTTQKSPAQAHERIIRIFISSTFRDMRAERDELVKFIFPQLRKLCEQRLVAWGEVDLRWGITDEQKSEGKVLPICLDEILRCRPYFIGVLGERYGWIPDKIPAELIGHEKWLGTLSGKSVTELEILHGVLNNPEMAKHAFFYFRDPKYSEKLPKEQRPDYLESASSQNRQKLADLKERIRKTGFPVHENYANPKEFGQWVLQDLTAIVDELFPEGSQPDPLDREAIEHEIFAINRVQVYIRRQIYFDKLDAHTRSQDPPMVILGESGSGKSALLANWARNYRKEHPDELVLMHFIGATPGSSDWAVMLRRILGEFKRKFNIQEEIPEQSDALRSAFANWLNMAASQGRVVLVLDALNQLDDRDGAPDLVWLPPKIPGNVRIFLSTLPSRPLEELKKRGWPSLIVGPLQIEERKQLIKDYLMLFTKALDKAHTERIASAVQCQNPLFLRVLLNELRQFGMYEYLGDQIDLYLQAATIPALYEMILKRCEHDYERDRLGLVREAMSLIWAARRGLSETELMELLGTDSSPLPHAYWSPLFLAIEQALLSPSGLIVFAHNFLRQAVQDRYLSEEKEQQNCHIRLVDYFADRELNQRKIDELPWQLAQAGLWQKLYNLLSDLPFCAAAWKINPFEVKAYWAQIENHSSLRLTEAYRPVINNPSQHGDHVWYIARLLEDTGHPAEALSLQAFMVGHFRQIDDRANLQGSLGNQANILARSGDLAGAVACYKEQELICRVLGDMHGFQGALGNQAIILATHGELDEALRLLKEQEQICRVLGIKKGLGNSLGNQANILKARGDLDGAMGMLKEQERIWRELGDMHGLQGSLGSQANILCDQGDMGGGMTLYKEQERIFREIGDKSGLELALGNQATILAFRGDLDGAMALHKEEEQICRELGDKDGLGRSLGNQANFLRDRGDLDGAMALHKEEERIYRELGNKKGLQYTLGCQANILYERGNLDEAMRLHKEEEQICRELGNKAGLGRSLGDQAVILYDLRNLEGAMALQKAAEQICRELGDKDGLGRSLGNQALILKARGDLDGAMALHKEEEQICRGLGDHYGLAVSLSNQGLILGLGKNQTNAALSLLAEAYRLAAEHGYVALAKQINGSRIKIYQRRT